MAFVRGYEHDRATVSEMHEYATCIDRLHPLPMDAGLLLLVKVVVAVLLAGMVIGVAREWRDGWSGSFIETVLSGCAVGLLVSGFGLLLIGGAWLGVAVLLS